MWSGPNGFATLDHEKNGMKKNCDTLKSFQTTSSIDRSIPPYIYLHIEISLVKHHIIAR